MFLGPPLDFVSGAPGSCKDREYEMANVLVTGGAGFVGSHLVEACLEAGDSVRVVDNLASGALENIPSGAVFHEGDMADAGFMRRVAEEARPDVIHHLAAQSSVTHSLAEPLRDARGGITSM